MPEWGYDMLISTGLLAAGVWSIVWHIGMRQPRQSTQRPIAPVTAPRIGRLPSQLNSRRVRLQKNGGRHTAQEWQALCAQYKGRCAACKQKRPLTKDHIVPVYFGGSDDISNLQPLCKYCNSKKGTRTIDYRKRPQQP